MTLEELNKLETAAALAAVRAVRQSMPIATREIAALVEGVAGDPLKSAEAKLARNLHKFNGPD